MDPASIFVTCLTLALLVALVTERFSLDALGVVLIAILVGTGILDVHQALNGFANHAVITIAALYVVGEGLTRTGAVEFLAGMVLNASGGRERRLLVLVCLVAAGVSAFLNNTAVVVVFIPVLLGMARDTGVPPSRLMLPLAYASLLGGMCTLVGTSTNLLVSGVIEGHRDQVLAQGGEIEPWMAPIGMFELSWVGVPMALLGIGFMALCSRWLLPARESKHLDVGSEKRTYITELSIGPTSNLLGKRFSEAFGEDGPRVRFVVRDERTLSEDFADLRVQAGDEILLEGDVDALSDMQSKLGLKMVGGVDYDARRMTYFELAVAPHSGAVGQRIDELHLHRDYGCVVVAMYHRDQEIRERASRKILRAGDLLLVCGDDNARRRVKASTDYFLLTGAQKQVILRQNARVALGIAAMVVVAFALYSLSSIKAVPPSLAALLGAVAMVATGCVTPRRVYRCIDWPILLFVVGTLALGEAMRETGAASTYAQGIVRSLQDLGPVAVIAGIVFLAIVMNALVSHSAVAVLLTPVAIQVAQQMTLDPRPFILAVAFGGSLAFVTPLGHQVNLMVYAPGGYRFTDFLRLGIPLSVLTWIAVTVGLAWSFGL